MEATGFNNNTTNGTSGGTGERSWTGAPSRAPRVDIEEFNDRFVMLVDLPGVAEEAVDLKFERGVLTLSAEAEAFRPPEGMKALHNEAAIRHFRREFTLGDEIDGERIDAALTDGVLRVTLPKSQKAKARKINIRGN